MHFTKELTSACQKAWKTNEFRSNYVALVGAGASLSNILGVTGNLATMIYNEITPYGSSRLHIGYPFVKGLLRDNISSSQIHYPTKSKPVTRKDGTIAGARHLICRPVPIVATGPYNVLAAEYNISMFSRYGDECRISHIEKRDDNPNKSTRCLADRFEEGVYLNRTGVSYLRNQKVLEDRYDHLWNSIAQGGQDAIEALGGRKRVRRMIFDQLRSVPCVDEFTKQSNCLAAKGGRNKSVKKLYNLGRKTLRIIDRNCGPPNMMMG